MVQILNQNRGPASGLMEDLPDAEQTQLTDRLIRPYAQDILSFLAQLRADLDGVIKAPGQVLPVAEDQTQPYPVGFCKQIRDAVLEVLEDELAAEVLDPPAGLEALRRFIKAGGLVKDFWGIKDAVVFQNAIQVGSMIFDVANDTVDPSSPDVVYYDDFESCPIKNIDSFEGLANVLEKYWNLKIYVNDVFPWLASCYPFIVYSPQNDTYALSRHSNYVLNAAAYYKTKDVDLVKMARDFVFNSRFTERTLPDHIRQFLTQPEHPLNQIILRQMGNPEVLRVPIEKIFEQAVTPERVEQYISIACTAFSQCPISEDEHRIPLTGPSLL